MPDPAIASRTNLAVALGAAALDTTLFSALSGNNTGTFVLLARPSRVVVVLSALPLALALLVRNRFPTAVALGLAGYAVGLTLTVGTRPLVVLLVSLYTAASWATPARSTICLTANLAAHAVTVAYETEGASRSSTVVAVALVFALFDLAAWWFGVRAARARAREGELVAHRALLAAEAVAAERLRIARELHDIVANAVTVIVLQAAGAMPRVREDPSATERALSSIERTADQAMAELRRLLVVLRAVSDSTELGGTAPGLASVDVLAEQAQESGIHLTLSIPDVLEPLDPSVDLAAFRIIQESLTNVARHAGRGARAHVTVTRRSGTVAVEVVDDGGGVTTGASLALSTGSGLVGLRERVSLLGGEFFDAAAPGGGWRVFAQLPLRAVEPGAAR